MPTKPESMPISHFKAKCLAVLERVRRTGRPVLVTRHGKPIAEVFPPAPTALGVRWIGTLEGRLRITGDIVGPVAGEDEWEVLRS